MPDHYPIFLDLEGTRCLVVGGGEVAAVKARGLLAAGARVLVVSPALSESLGRLAAQGSVSHRAREFRDDDVDGCRLVIAATDRPDVNSAVCAAARRRGALVNVVDTPPECDFYTPAVARRGALQIAISTEGKSPTLARRIREELEERFGPEYERYVEILGAIREESRRRRDSFELRKRILGRIADSDLLAAVRAGDEARIAEIIATAGLRSDSDPVAAQAMQ